VVVTQVDKPMRRWPPNTRLYVDEAGQHYAVHADGGLSAGQQRAVDFALGDLGLPAVKSGMHTIVLCETTIVACDENGIAPELTPMCTCPPGTSHEDALVAAGLEIAN